MKTEIDSLYRELRAESSKQELERAVAIKELPDYTTAKVSFAKLKVSGLVQVWYQAIQNDSRGIVKPAPGNLAPFPEPNGTNDNDTFRIRRTELRFELALDKHVKLALLIDPARESNISFTPIPTFPHHNTFLADPAATGGSQQQSNGGVIPQVFQDANIVLTNLVPHHEFTFGQFKPPSGEEAWRDSGYLNFVERAMSTSINNVRDTGVMCHGSWFPAAAGGPPRFEYWLGVFNGPAGTILSDPEIVEGGNRTDDNDAKDFSWRVLGRPVWDKDKWFGRLEVGLARTDGYRGESGSLRFSSTVLNTLDFPVTAVNRQSAWVWYRPGGPPSGWWLRAEWNSGRDSLNYSFLPPTSLFGLGTVLFNNNSVPGTAQVNAGPVSASGWYVASGYNIGDSVFAKKLSASNCALRYLKNLEFTGRYETYQNIAGENLANPDRQTDLFATQAVTVGFNYYLKGYHYVYGHDAKFQANYILVTDPRDPRRGLRSVNNDVFVASFQFAF